MGRSTTPAYRVELHAAECGLTPMAWNVRDHYQVKGYGKPTPANLATFVKGLEDSFTPSGVNGHIGHPLTVQSARIIRQSTGEVVARYTGPAFVVVAQS